jgi:hypothetical protein
MLRDIPRSNIWAAHLMQRFNEAKEDVGLVSAGVVLSPQSAEVFVPEEISPEDFTKSSPHESLRSLLKHEYPTKSGWVRRNDMFEEVAEWLHATCNNSNAQLFCEAGLSKLGDPVLSNRPHVVHQGKPLLRTEIGEDSIEVVATVLRWGRGLRFLGVVPSGSSQPIDSFALASKGLFLCDAYDNDSLIVASF